MCPYRTVPIHSHIIGYPIKRTTIRDLVESAPRHGPGLYVQDKAVDLLDQTFHVVTTSQELRHSTRNFVRMAGDYLRTNGPPVRSMAI